MSLMNDILSSLQFPLFETAEQDLTLYSLGLAYGLIALGLNLGVAVIAAVNSALASYYGSSEAVEHPDLRPRVVLCICGQFIAAIFAGVAFTQLSIVFVWPAAATAGGIYLCCMVTSIYHAQKLWNWKRELRKEPLGMMSFIVSAMSFGSSVADEGWDSWIIVPAFTFSLLFHLMTLILRPVPSWETIVSASLLFAMWGGSIPVILKVPSFAVDWAVIFRCVTAGIEAIIMAAIGIRALVMMGERTSLIRYSDWLGNLSVQVIRLF